MHEHRTPMGLTARAVKACWRAAVLAAIAAVMAVAGMGAPRALLIGVNYQGSAISPLPGIDLDVELMEQVARDLGIADIRRLENRDATLQGIRAAMRELSEHVGPDDLTLIYFSGHGTQVPDRGNMDEDDGWDEALLPFDAKPVTERVVNEQGKARDLTVDIDRGLIDDEFYEMLEQLRSDRVLLVIDACNSGTAARSVLGAQPKYYPVSSPRRSATKAPGSSRTFAPSGGEAAAAAKFVGIMAAQDDELAMADLRGSALTYAVAQSINAMRVSGASSVTVEELFERVNQDVARQMAKRYKNHRQRPNLFVPPGSAALKGLVLEFNRGSAGDRRLPFPEDDPLLKRWTEYADGVEDRVELTVPRQSFALHPAPTGTARDCAPEYSEHLLTFEVQAPADGYFNVLNVGQGEQDPVVLFPNGFAMQDNRVSKGESIVMPPPGVDWCLPAASIPAGLDSQWVLIVAAFSTDPLNFYRDGTGGGPFKAAPKAAPKPFGVSGGGSSPDSRTEPSVVATATAQVLIRRGP